ncbi:MAG: helix-turn-helix transcriptional regulator [Spirochaetaceae bacterium]|nr:helix-turn-helix transcriptional regulator [Spirochaetaceae bacterium]
MTNLRTVLSFNMKERRKKLNLSQANLAEIMDTSPNYIYKIEAEKQFPSVQMIEQIALALNCDSIDLFSTGKIKETNLDILKNSLRKDINNLVDRYFKEI